MHTAPFLVCTLAILSAELLSQAPIDRPAFVQPPAALAAAPFAAAAAATTVAEQQRLGQRGPDHVQFDRPRADGPIWALGRAWKASFDAQGCTVIPFFGATAPSNFPLRLELASASVGGTPLPLLAGEPVATDGTVRTPRGALTEVIDTSLDTLEQSFVFATLPKRGAIALDVRMTGALQPTPIAEGLRFANDFGHIDYTKAVAVDAAGRRQPLAITWTGSSAHMEIPAEFVEQATLPIVLDPILNYWYLLASATTQPQSGSDVASIQSNGGRVLMIWQRQFSLTDMDCFGLMFDGNLGLVATDFTIDFTSEDWLEVAVAGNNFAQNFLVVAETRIGTLSYIGGRLIGANAAVGAAFDIERNGVVGSGGDNFHPDVGADPYFGPGNYLVAFQKRSGSVSDIYCKQVTPAGQLATLNPTALDTSPNVESRPSVSKSCGQSNGLPASWLVSWQRTFASAPNDQEVHGRFVSWNGAVIGNVFGIGITIAEETAPAPGSPIDVNGVRFWPVCYETASAPGQPRDVLCKLLRVDGSTQASFTVSNGTTGTDEREPAVDSDGTRFVVCMTTSVGAPQGVQAATIAFLPTTNSFRVEDRSTLATTGLDNHGQCDICADHSGSSSTTPRYRICFAERNTNTFRLAAFDGHTGDTNYFSYRPSQCGAVTIQATGSPVIGQTVTVAVNGPGFTGTLLGFPSHVPLNAGCACWLGVDPSIAMANPLVWNVPNNPAYVGITLAAQGFSFGGSQCLGTIDLSDTVDFTIR